MHASASIVFELLPARRRAERFSVDPVTGGPRKLHIRRLFDLLHVSELRRDTARAQRIWSILVRCREVDFSLLWDLGLRLLHFPHPQSTEDDSTSVERHLSYLKACKNLSLEESSKVLLEYLCVLVSVGRTRDALDEVELYLSILPHSQHPGLHEYAGMLALSLAQPLQIVDDTEEPADGSQAITEYIISISNTPYFGKAKAYFERAQSLDASSLVAAGYLQLLAVSQSGADFEVD